MLADIRLAHLDTVLLCSVALPALLPFLVSLVPRLEDFTRSSYINAARKDSAQTASLIFLRLVFWADQAWVMADAIIRTLYRLGISRRRLLEWTTTAQSKAGASSTWLSYYRRMSGSILWVFGATLLLITGPGFPGSPCRSCWRGCSLRWRRARSADRRAGRAKNRWSSADADGLRNMARQTWSFFDTFVTAEQNMLPPDNFQEIPNPVVAHRTSPTNIGLYLLSIAAARDFGWIGAYDAMDRLEATFSSLDKLERFRGHFYNWYDTHDLRPLDPKYISTVDSGNLAGHFLTLEGICRGWLKEPAPARPDLGGIEDTLEQLQIVARESGDERRSYGVSPRQLDTALDAL